MKKEYTAPRLSVYGNLADITLGLLGNAPDAPPLNNDDCVTGTVATNGITVTVSCGVVIQPGS